MGAGARLGYAAVLLAATDLAACSLTSLDGLTSPASAATEGGSVDGAFDASLADGVSDAPIDVSKLDAGDAAGVNLYPRGGTLDTSCEPFVGFQGTVTPTSTARTGAGACRVCTNPMTTDYFTADDGGEFGAVAVGERYRARVWVRAEVGAPAAPGVTLHLRTVTPPFNTVTNDMSPTASIDATWKQLETTTTVTEASRVNVYVAAGHAPGACFVLDDVTLERLP